MWVPVVIVAVIVLLPVIYVIATYNTLVALRNHIRDAWSNIDTELKRRYDLIPNLVATVKGYAAHEKEIFRTHHAAPGPVHVQPGSASGAGGG